MRRCRLLRPLLCTLVLCAACSTDGTREQADHPPPADGGVGTTIPSDLEADPLQDELLADGSISPAEMERALLAVVACVERDGFDADLELDRFGYGFTVNAPTEELADQGDRVLNRCEAEILSSVAPVFVRDNTPSEQEYAELDQRIAACLSASGIEEVENLSLAEKSEVVDPFMLARCEESSR